MARRYELTDQEWEQIAPLLPPEKNSRPGRPSKDNRLMINAMIWIARSGAPWRDLPERYGSWNSVYSRFRKWVEDGTLDNVFRVLNLDAELDELFLEWRANDPIQKRTLLAKGQSGLWKLSLISMSKMILPVLKKKSRLLKSES